MIPENPIKPLRLEDQILLCCARTPMSGEQAARLQDLVRGNVNWSLLKQRAMQHGLLPLVCHNLTHTCSEQLPQDVVYEFGRYYFAHARRSLSQVSQLFKIMQLFKQQGIAAIPFKGPMLALSAYNDVTLRVFDDLDFLLRKKDVLGAKALLISQGYRPSFDLESDQESTYLNSPFHYSHHLMRDEGISFVDLHWAVEPTYLSFVLNSDGLWDRLAEVSLDGHVIQTISREDMVLLLCIHGARHRWERLIWLADLGQLVRTPDGLDWEWISEQTRKLGNERMLWLGLTLVRDVLGEPLPPAVSARAEKDGMLETLVGQVKWELFRENWYVRSGLVSSIFYLKTMKRLSDRMKYVFSMFVAPTPSEWSDLPLPKRMHFLYYFVRPIRVVSRFLSRPLDYLQERKHKEQACHVA